MLITRKSEGRSWLMLIAEFILVVGGVLVALWLDSVKQGYRDRLLENQYLVELEEDLSMDLEEVSSTIATAKARLAAAERLMLASGCAFRRNPELKLAPTNSYGKEIELVLEIHVIDGARAAINELQGSGNLRVMRDRSLVRRLQDYYSEWDRKVEGEHGQLRPDLQHLRRALSDVAIAADHGMTIEEIGAIIAKNPIVQAELRQAHYQAGRQILRLNKLDGNVRKTLADVQAQSL